MVDLEHDLDVALGREIHPDDRADRETRHSDRAPGPESLDVVEAGAERPLLGEEAALRADRECRESEEADRHDDEESDPGFDAALSHQPALLRRVAVSSFWTGGRPWMKSATRGSLQRSSSSLVPEKMIPPLWTMATRSLTAKTMDMS